MLLNTQGEGQQPDADSADSQDAGSDQPTSGGTLLDDMLTDDGADVLDTGIDEFAAAMASIGEDTIIGEDEDDEPAEATDEDESEGEELEDDEDAGDEAGDEEEAEEADEDDDVDEDEPEDEDEDDDDDEQPADALAPVFDRLKKNLGLEITSADQLAETIEKEVKANTDLIELYDKQPQLLEITRAVMGGKGLTEAIVDAIGEIDDDNPEVIKARARQEAQREAQQERLELAREQADKDLQAFQKKQEMSDEELADFRSDVARYVYGDPRTGQLPADFLEVMHRGLRYDQDVAEAKKTGKVEGKNEAVREKRKKRKAKGDGLPSGRSGRTDPNPAPREASLENLASDLSTSGVLENL